jgi:hypothetical protein
VTGVETGSDLAGTTSEPLLAEVRALLKRVSAIDALSSRRLDALHADVRRALEALLLIYDDDVGTRRALRDLRRTQAYEAAFSDPRPLVSVVIPTWNRPELLVQRSIASALAQTHENVEVVVVGDGSPPEVGEAVAAVTDDRVVFHNRPIRGPYYSDPLRAWLAVGTPAANVGLGLARGSWITLLSDDDELMPTHIETILEDARRRRLEFVYCRIRMLEDEGRETLLNEFPPLDGQIALQGALLHGGLSFIEYEPGWPIFGKPNDWGMAQRLLRVGVRVGMLDAVGANYYPSKGFEEAQRRLAAERPPLDDPELGWDELARELSEHLAAMEVRVEELKAERAAITVERDTLAAQLSSITETRAMRAARGWWRVKERVRSLLR